MSHFIRKKSAENVSRQKQNMNLIHPNDSTARILEHLQAGLLHSFEKEQNISPFDRYGSCGDQANQFYDY